MPTVRRDANAQSRELKDQRIMPDLAWLAVLGCLFLLTLAFVRLCEKA